MHLACIFSCIRSSLSIRVALLYILSSMYTYTIQNKFSNIKDDVLGKNKHK